ncbi:hypothetical protein ABFA07_015849 [Porites harrisoni]
MSKISGIGQKLFRWKKAEKVPKKEWPELVGKGAEEATMIIDKEHPGLKIQIIPENSVVKQNFDERRVRIIVDRKQTVIKTPHIG